MFSICFKVFIHTIYLSSEGVYNQLNVETLQDDNDTYLIDKYDILLVSNTKDLAITRIYEKKKIKKNQFDFNLTDISEVWRRGSVVASWLLDLTANSLVKDPGLKDFAGRVSDSGEGRWTIKAAIDEGVPVPVLTTALYERFSSRGDAEFQDKLLSAMRFQFGGHLEKK